LQSSKGINKLSNGVTANPAKVKPAKEGKKRKFSIRTLNILELNKYLMYAQLLKKISRNLASLSSRGTL